MNRRLSIIAIGVLTLSLSFFAQQAAAGLIRSAKRGVGKGTEKIASGAVTCGAAAADGVSTAGKATKGALATGLGTVGSGAKAAPQAVAEGTKKLAKKVGRAIW